MSQALIDKIKKARQSKVECGKFKFIVARPTDMDTGFMSIRGMQIRELLAKYVVGWEDVTELDLVAGGMPDPVPFDSALFLEWAEDKPEIWAPIGKAVKEAYTAYRAKAESETKN